MSLCVGLKFLVRLCTDMNLKEAQDYANRLKKAEKMQKLREEVRQIYVFLLRLKSQVVWVQKFKLYHII